MERKCSGRIVIAEREVEPRPAVAVDERDTALGRRGIAAVPVLRGREASGELPLEIKTGDIIAVRKREDDRGCTGGADIGDGWSGEASASDGANRNRPPGSRSECIRSIDLVCDHIALVGKRQRVSGGTS